jgi:cupin 2 domain-containing protein
MGTAFKSVGAEKCLNKRKNLNMNESMKIKSGNLFSNIPLHADDEIFDTILASDGCKIKRIISRGNQSPPDYWYDQERNEWVMVLKGSAALKFENSKKIVEMMPGDYVYIPSHCKHRVEWTDPEVETIWLAVYF